MFGKTGEGIDAKAEGTAFFAAGGFSCFDLLEDLGELFAEEDRDNGGRSFVCAEAVVVSGACDDGAQESGVFADGADDSGAKDEKADIEVWIVAGFEEVSDLGVAEGKVDVFSGAVDASEGFFVCEAGEAMAGGDAFECGECELLVISGDVGVFVDGGDLVLSGGDFVVSGFDGYTEFEEFVFGIEHKVEDAFADGPEVVVFHLLAFGGFGPKQRASRRKEVRALMIEVVVDQEVFLFSASGGDDHFFGLIAKQFEDALGLLVEGLDGAQQRGFSVEGFTCPRDKGGGDAKSRAVGGFEEVGGAGDVPSGVSASFEGLADAACGKARTIGFALDELCAAEFGDGSAFVVGGKERVVFFGAEARERIKDMSVMGGPASESPCFHGGSDGVSGGRV